MFDRIVGDVCDFGHDFYLFGRDVSDSGQGFCDVGGCGSDFCDFG